MQKSIEFAQLVKGKTCIVVAPSGYLKGRGALSGKFIESFDCVVKCTRTIEIDDLDNELGSRCDLWYGLPYYSSISWGISFDALHRQGVKLMCFRPRSERYAVVWDESLEWFLKANSEHDFPWQQVCLSTNNRLIEQFDCVPYMGVVAVIDLLNKGAETVYAYGHDFYQSGYFNDLYSSLSGDSNWHKVEPQMKLLWNLLQSEPRFDCDDNLKQLLSFKFGTELDVRESRLQLFNTDLQHFFWNKKQSLLVFRSCNIEYFKQFLSGIEAYFNAENIHVLCQKGFICELEGYKSDIIDYQSDESFSKDLAMTISALKLKHFDSCLIPYNGLELLTYYQIFLIVAAIGINNVYLVSTRGSLSKLKDLDDEITRIERYMTIRDEFRVLSDKYDRTQCF